MPLLELHEGHNRPGLSQTHLAALSGVGGGLHLFPHPTPTHPWLQFIFRCSCLLLNKRIAHARLVCSSGVYSVNSICTISSTSSDYYVASLFVSNFIQVPIFPPLFDGSHTLLGGCAVNFLFSFASAATGKAHKPLNFCASTG